LPIILKLLIGRFGRNGVVRDNTKRRIFTKNYLYFLQQGDRLLQQNRTNDAIDSFKQSLQLNPTNIPALLKLAIAYQSIEQFDAAEAAYNQILKLSQGNSKLRHGVALIHNALALIEFKKGNLNEAITRCRKILKTTYHAAMHSNFLGYLNYDPAQTNAMLLKEHSEWGRRYGVTASKSLPPHNNAKTPDKKLRIGYVSADFREHPVARFLLPVLINHQHEAVDIYCYSNNPNDDGTTTLIRRYANHWQSIRTLSDEQAAEMIRRDGIDILVDLSGHTADNRLLVFAHKPAPIQISWLGYFNTTGLNTIDYFISDPIHNPPGSEQYYTEKIIRMPDCYIAYAPRNEADEKGWKNLSFIKPFIKKNVPATPALANGYITFGNFNHVTKMNDEVIKLWSSILTRVAGSRLILKGFDYPPTITRIKNDFANYGIDPERIEIRGKSSLSELYLQYQDIDIALDPFPFNGGATTFDALWMGVPVVTLSGETTISRQSATYLSHMGLTELVAHDKEEYETIACNLASNLDQLTSLRKNLRQRLLISPLCDGKKFTQNLELVYRQLWQEWCGLDK